jgi:carbon storage regulator
MLILTRNRRQAVMIGDDVTLTVMEVRGDRVRLGIKAPPEIAIERQKGLNPGEGVTGQPPARR